MASEGSTTQDPQLVGQRLGAYRVLEQIGAGGMGVVYRAEDTRLGRQVAIKVLPAEFARDPERLGRFEREARSLAALSHPNIVTIHSVEHVDGFHFLTMELVDGEPLSKLIPRDGMPLRRIFGIGIPLAEALAAAHAKGIVHRDLKPGNVVVPASGPVKVLDFGLAKLQAAVSSDDATELLTEPLTTVGQIVGTVPYMSPEQLEGREPDPRSDIFSLGTILYEMATGQRPFGGPSSLAVMSSILKDAPREIDTRRADLPNHLARVISHCLEKSPEQRYQSAQDVRNELMHLRREIEGTGTVPLTSVVTGRPPRRRWRRPAVAAVIALGLTAAAVLVVRQWPERTGETESASAENEARRAAGRIANTDARLLFTQGERYWRRGLTRTNLRLAEQTWRRALELEPNNAFLAGELAALLAARQRIDPEDGREQEVLALVEQAEGGDEPVVGPWLARAELARAAGDFETAVDAARQAHRLEPADSRAPILLGESLIARGQHEEGLAELERAVELGADQVNTRHALATALARLGRLEEAALEYREVIRFAPDHAGALNNLAIVYMRSGRYLEAAPLFQRVLELQPDYRPAANNLGTVYFYLDRPAEAVDAYLNAYRMDPEHPMTQHNLGDAYASLGDQAESRRWYLAAIDSCDRRIAAAGAQPGLVSLRLLSVAKVGRHREATAAIDARVAESPEDPELLYNAAQIHAVAGDKPGLLRLVEQAIRAGYPREEFRQAPEFAAYAGDAEFSALLLADLSPR